MNENEKSCASTDFTTHTWDSIDWNKCEKEVRRLQARIVKAQREGKHGKVKALQWTLTHSFSAKTLAVKRVTSNKGGSTPGVDNVVWSTSKSKMDAIEGLKRKGYSPQPLRRVNIKKSNGKLRPLGIPTMKDRAMQALYQLALDPVSETTADNHSYGFRKERSAGDAMEQCFIILSKNTSAQWVMEGDIKGCFDHISHDWLLDNIPMDKTILNKWLKCGFVFNQQLFTTEEGTPQGGIISPTLANMTLDGLQKILLEKYKVRKVNNKGYSPKVNLVRYADDFIITARNKEILTEEVAPLLKEFLSARGLTLSEEKTKITHIEDGFDFLGFNVQKYKGKLLIKPSTKGQKQFKEKVKEIISSHKSIPQESLIRMLNPVITGWGNYYRHQVSAKIFQDLDKYIFRRLFEWSLRRHPSKGKRWVANKYFNIEKYGKWVFASSFKNDKSNKVYPLKKLAEIKITRYTKVKHDANPYDLEWNEYFEKRSTYKMLLSASGRTSVLSLWKRQNKVCPYCGEAISQNTPWRISKLTVNGAIKNTMVHNYCGRRYPKSIKLEEYEPVSN